MYEGWWWWWWWRRRRKLIEMLELVSCLVSRLLCLLSLSLSLDCKRSHTTHSHSHTLSLFWVQHASLWRWGLVLLLLLLLFCGTGEAQSKNKVTMSNYTFVCCLQLFFRGVGDTSNQKPLRIPEAKWWWVLHKILRTFRYPVVLVTMRAFIIIN